MNKIRILVIGESCTDEFIYCKSDRLSPEAPVPVLNPIKTVKNRGMSGNTTTNLKSILPNSQVTSVIQTENITKTRYIENKSNHMFLRVDKGEDSLTPIEWTNDIIESIKQADIVVVSDYNKGFLNDSDVKRIGELSELSILDSKRKLNNDIINSYTFIKLNESEYDNNKHLTHNGIIVTLGSKGARHGSKLYPSLNPQETIDVSGAGDTFTASFITAYYITSDISEAIITANKNASNVVSRRGVVTPK